MMRALHQAVARGQALPQMQQQAALAAASMTTMGQSMPFGTSADQDRTPDAPSSMMPIPTGMLCQRRSPALSPLHEPRLSSAISLAVRHAGHASGPPIDPNRDVWAELRAEGSPDNRLGLGGGYYSLIIVFGFASMLHDSYAFPPRILAMMGLMTLVMYTRRFK